MRCWTPGARLTSVGVMRIPSVSARTEIGASTVTWSRNLKSSADFISQRTSYPSWSGHRMRAGNAVRFDRRCRFPVGRIVVCQSYATRAEQQFAYLNQMRGAARLDDRQTAVALAVACDVAQVQPRTLHVYALQSPKKR